MKEPTAPEFSEIKHLFPDIDDTKTARTQNRMNFEDYRRSSVITANLEEHPEEAQTDEPAEVRILNIPQKSTNILEHIYLLNTEREQLQEQIRKIDEDVKYLYRAAYDQGARKIGSYELKRKERSTRSLNVDKFRTTYPEIFEQHKKVSASAIEKAIGKEEFQRQMKESHPEEYDAVAKVTITDIQKELPKMLIDEVCDWKKSVSFDITRNGR
ncbi:hypothetical protein AZH53_09770 [Methanomicrobiaceae archaeon CYW5]|uniref:hypothetical protein n=1 Tax=Methanovulcanius yangii TaxID=1789227 RepID=UPI0029CA8AD4|nr:hypothetical protein [Methanovulcanius yangii]MBT8508691.1 hypothetical protein [Methanovulcanius yangii]